jgi:hypothetical protein
VPELEIERRENRGVPGWVWLVAAVILGLIIWGIVAATNNRQAAVAPADRVAGERQETPGMEMLPIGAIVGAPDQYFDKDVRGAARVTEVISDRGFWVESEGQRALVMLAEGIPEAGVNVEAGQQLDIQGVFLRPDAANTSQVEPQAAQVLQDQPGFIRANSVDILQPAT